MDLEVYSPPASEWMTSRMSGWEGWTQKGLIGAIFRSFLVCFVVEAGCGVWVSIAVAESGGENWYVVFQLRISTSLQHLNRLEKSPMLRMNDPQQQQKQQQEEEEQEQGRLIDENQWLKEDFGESGDNL